MLSRRLDRLDGRATVRPLELLEVGLERCALPRSELVGLRFRHRWNHRADLDGCARVLPLDGDPAAVVRASYCGLHRRDSAVAVTERRERRVVAAFDRCVHVGEEVAERLAVALAVARWVAGEAAR